MFINPFSAGTALVRKGAQTQLSLLMSLSGNLLHATMQLTELNQQATRRLLEESAADMQRAMQLHTLSDVQSFVGEQSKMSVERVQGYWQNLQNIAAENVIGTQQVLASSATSVVQGVAPKQGREQKADNDEGQDEDASSSQQHKHPHEVDVQPSPLVEKLVASVAVEPPEART